MTDDGDELIEYGVVMRLADLFTPVAGSVVVRCVRCLEQCWQGPLMPADVMIVCSRCLPAVASDHGDDVVNLLLTEEQRAEFRAAGMTDGEIEYVMELFRLRTLP